MRYRDLTMACACLILAMAGTTWAQNTNTNSNTNTNGNTNANGNSSNTNSGGHNSNRRNSNRNTNSNMNSNSNSNSNTDTNTNTNSNTDTDTNTNTNTNSNTNMSTSGTRRSGSYRNSSTGAAMSGGSATAAAPMGGSAAALDQKFIMDAAMGNNAEIQMGQLALQRASSPEVKAFAQMMVDNHGAANAQLAQAASAAGITLPTGVPPNARILMAGMQNISGPEFDMAYVKQQLGDHAATVDMYEMARKEAKDKGAKDYAKKILPVIEQHYQQVKAMDMRMSPAATAATMPGSR